MRRVEVAMLSLALFAACAARVRAEVTGIEIDRREPFAGGRAFGATGAYEVVAGRVSFAIDPLAAANARIADVRLAPRDARGRVRFSSDFVVVRPVAADDARASVLLETINRGNSDGRYFFYGSANRGNFALPELKDQRMDDAFAFENGFTLAFLGWETNPANGTMRLYAPDVAVTGTVRGSVLVEPDDVTEHTFAFVAPNGACPVDATQPERRLVMRRSFDDAGTVVPAVAWHFTTVHDSVTGKTSCAFAVARPIVPHRMYDAIYRGGTTAVAGLSFAAFRDFASYLKHGDPASPLHRDAIPRVLGFGYSQSARYLRTFLREGFNADEDGRIAYDGMLIASAGAGGGSFDQRYAMTGEAGTSVGSDLRPTDVFPFTDTDETDPLTGERGSLLERARASHTVPKTFTTLSSTEYWARFASLTYLAPGGGGEVPLDANSRRYFFAGTPHGTGVFPPQKRIGGSPLSYDANYATAAPGLRALLLDLDTWIARGTEPPPSVFPHPDGLVPRARVRFPAIPGVAFPAYAPRTWRMDYGPRFASLGIADDEPPRLGAPYDTFVPQVDADGNDAGGIALPFLAVPVGTFTGWNVEPQSEPSFGLLAGLFGSFVPFARTAAERVATGDPRPSLGERYATRAAYLDATRAAARALVARRLMIESDVEPEVAAAARRYDAVP